MRLFLPPCRNCPRLYVLPYSHAFASCIQHHSDVREKNQRAGEESLHTRTPVPGTPGGGSGQESPRGGSPHHLRCCPGKERQERLDRVECACSQPDVPKTVFGDICLNSRWRYRSAMSRSLRICCSLACVPGPARANIRGKSPLVLMSTVTGKRRCT